MGKNLPYIFTSILLITVFTVALSKPAFAFDSTPSYGFTYIPTIDDASRNVTVRDFATDSEGNVYTVGSFYGEVNFNPSGSDIKTALSSQDAFVTKINSDGSYGYTKTISALDDEYLYGIAFDSDDIMYLTGYFYATVDFDWSSGVDEHTSPSGSNMFLTKINSDGTYGYTKIIEADSSAPSVINVDSNGNIYIGGSFLSTVDFDPTGSVDNHTSNGVGDAFLTKFNSNGTYAFTYTWGGENEDIINGIDFDSDSNVYYSGYYRDNSVDLDPTSGTDEHTIADFFNGYVAKISSEGNYLGSYVLEDEVSNMIRNLAIDSENRIYITGELYGTLDFDRGAGVDEHTTEGDSDIFLARLNSDLSYDYAYTWGTTDGIEQGIGLAVDGFDNVYLRGRTSGQTSPMDFDPTSGEDIKSETDPTGKSLFATRINEDKTYGFTAYLVGAESDEDYSIGYGEMYPMIEIDFDGNLYIGGLVNGSAINYNPYGSDIKELDYPLGTYSFLTKFIVPSDPEAPDDNSSNGDEDDDNSEKEVKKCEDKRPPQANWIKIKPTTQNGIRGLLVTWIQYDANKIRIAIDDGTGMFPWITDKISNDGHEFLPNVAASQKIMIKPINGCKEGLFSPAVSYQLNPLGWFSSIK